MSKKASSVHGAARWIESFFRRDREQTWDELDWEIVEQVAHPLLLSKLERDTARRYIEHRRADGDIDRSLVFLERLLDFNADVATMEASPKIKPWPCDRIEYD